MALSIAMEGDIFRVVCEEEFDLEDLRTTFFEVAESHGSKEMLRILVDDHASHFRPSASDLRNISRIWTEAYGGHPVRIALLVAREIHFGMDACWGPSQKTPRSTSTSSAIVRKPCLG